MLYVIVAQLVGQSILALIASIIYRRAGHPGTHPGRAWSTVTAWVCSTTALWLVLFV